MIVLQILMLIFCMVILPFGIGVLPGRWLKKEDRTLTGIWISGYLVLFALFELVGIPVVLFTVYHGFSRLCLIFGLLAGGGFLAGVVRLLKKKYRNLPIGSISMMFDAMVVLLTGLVFRDISKALYSGVVVFVCGQVIDAVVYRFDYSRVALIISKEHEKIAKAISDQLDRGATYLHGSGSYTHQNIEVVLAVVRKGQLAELKELVMDIDENAFVIVQEAHQVLGDGFAHYSPDSL